MLILQSLDVLPGESGARLDRFLRDRFPGVPSRSVRFAIEGGAVRVGGVACPKGRILRGGEIVAVASLAEEKDWLPIPSDLRGASIAYEDPDVAVLCKPHDAHTEPQRPLEAGTLAGYLRMLHPKVAEIAPVPGLTLLTRLDFATSGAVPAALTAQAWTYLRHQREMGAIENRWSVAEASLAALLAGADLLLICHDHHKVRASLATLRQALADGRLAEGRLQRSLRRLMTMQARFAPDSSTPAPRQPPDKTA